MLRIRKILLRGNGVQDACVDFNKGANILAGESDTGKSYLISCVDYIFGAEKLKKKLKEAADYSDLYVEFENDKEGVLTLKRDLGGGKLKAYDVPIHDISGEGKTIAPVRKGKSQGPDVTSILFPFAGIREAKLRKNARGETQRFSIRTLAPMFLVDEVSIIDEYSPVTGRSSYDDTVRKRMFSYLLTGHDDDGVAAEEKPEIVRARLMAKLEFIQEIIQPLDERFSVYSPKYPLTPPSNDLSEQLMAKAIDEVERATAAISNLHEGIKRETAFALKTESQLLGVAEIHSRYNLLKERYHSDLKRLDFLAEGSHYFTSLQEVPCSLCGQNLPHSHSENAKTLMNSDEVRRSASAEAAKIHAYLADLQKAIGDLNHRKEVLDKDKSKALESLEWMKGQIKHNFEPLLVLSKESLDIAVEQRAERDAELIDRQRWLELLKYQGDIETLLENSSQPRLEWGGLSSHALAELCIEIEAVLKDWKWSAEPDVSFNEKEYDIIVDGQPRQSHGKGVRAILYSAFVIGLLKYCVKKGRPHPGLVVIDSPLTSYKKKSAASVSGSDEPISAGIEEGFWHSLTQLPDTLQIIVIENKEPPVSIMNKVHYEWFAGENAMDSERAALIPMPKKR
ncbi:hypothetical protein JY436_02605 [Serratia marcescens]|uniref:hypothetical protein n=1 Tax=Enterobacterales TaxID=91347 RepID=UPI00193968E9|nr:MULTISPECIES: hypothetical protein [Enterobacterales]MBM1117599.1 hypothetical protein [Klebsiella grimontii]MBN5237932.1 hypothetical protein [Serratia marcescens]